MGERVSETAERQIACRGFHHVAVVTRDLDETVRFYRGHLGLQVGEVVDRTTQGAVSRQCFIKPGEAETWGLHFFESQDAEPHAAAGRLDSESLLG